VAFNRHCQRRVGIQERCLTEQGPL
jgi:hypothetical protein